MTQADSQKTALPRLLSASIENSNELTDCITTYRIDEEGRFQTALAQTATRAIALYFSRPVRLFRPSKSKYEFAYLPPYTNDCCKLVDGSH